MPIKRKYKKHRVKTRTHKRFIFSRGRASMYVFLFILLISFASYVIIGGVTPKNYLTEPAIPPGTQPVDIVRTTDPGTGGPDDLPGPGTPGYVTPGGPTVTSVPGGGGKEDNLQLKTIKFTERQRQCFETVAIDFLVDRSGSMGREGRMLNLQNALKAFTDPTNLSDDSVVGMQSFDSGTTRNPAVREDFSIDYYRGRQELVREKIDALRPGGNTWLRTAMKFARDKIREAQPRFPDRKFTLIFLTDGDPVTSAGSDGDEEPTRDPNVADEIKAMDVTIYTIGIAPSAGQDTRLKQIATTPNHYIRSQTGSDLTQIYADIGQRICN